MIHLGNHSAFLRSGFFCAIPASVIIGYARSDANDLCVEAAVECAAAGAQCAG